MLKMTRTVVCMMLACILACVASAQQISVTSPTNNAYLGTTNTLSFNITGATFQTTVTATITGPTGSSQVTQNFTPLADGTIAGTLPLNFSSSNAGGSYTISVTATSQGATFNTVTIPVTVVTTGPKFLDFTPISGVFVTGTCHIRASISDSFLDNWTVTIDGGNIPNNSGTTTTVAVDWDSSTAGNGSSHTITITATDLAGNTATENMSVTVDNTKPSINMTYPQASVAVVGDTTINVIIDVTDVSSSAIDRNSIDVIAQTLTGVYITRVARVSVSALNSTTLRWTGRIQPTYIRLPSRFVLVATATNLAGNVATPGNVTVTLR